MTNKNGWRAARTAGVNPLYRTPEHKAARRALLDAYSPGDPCCLCGGEMWPDEDGTLSGLHADHDPDDPARYRGLAHAECNVRDGARRGRARQLSDGSEPPPWWQGRDYHPCPACGVVVELASQRCCSRECADALRRIKTEAKRIRSAIQPSLNLCPECGSLCLNTYCDNTCGTRYTSRNAYRRRAGIPLDSPLSNRGRPRRSFSGADR